MKTSIEEEFVQLLLQHLQNVTCDVAIQAIESLDDDTKFSRQLFFEWRILEVVETIKLVKKDYMRTKIRHHLQQLDKESSYDLMMRGCLERYKYHPLTALQLFQQSIDHNSINYETRMYIANTLDSDALNKRLECSHELEYSMYICQLVIDRLQHCMNELQLDPKMLEFTMNEHYSFLYLLKYVL
jgi:glycogen synthase